MALVSDGRAVGSFADLGFCLGGGLLIVRDAVGDADRAVAEGQQLGVALWAAFVDLAIDQLAIGVDFAMDPHGGSREEHDVHALLAVHGGERFAEHQRVSEKESADHEAGAIIHDLSVNLIFLIPCEIDDAELSGLACASWDADRLRPVSAAGALIEEHAVRASAVHGGSRHADDGADVKVSGFGDDKMLRQVDFSGQCFAGFDRHFAEDHFASRGGVGAARVLDDEVEPL